MLIKDAKERAQRAEKNRLMLWEFLAIHTYSNLETMTHHLGFKTKAPVSKILSYWCEANLVKKVEIKNKFGKATVFGVTQKGLEDDSRRPMQPSRINLRTLEHTLKCQRASSYFLKAEATKKHDMTLVNIESGNLKKYGLTHRPDLIMQSELNPEFGLVCIEVELSIKSLKRYVNIFKTYLHSINSGMVNQVVYVFYDEKLAKRFKVNILDKFIQKHDNKNQLKNKLRIKVLS